MKVLIFGATGAAGGSVLQACLTAPEVDEVRVIARRPVTVKHDKLHALVHDDYLDYTAVERAFTGIDACFFCLGVSVTQTSGEAEYRKITRDFAVAAARTMRRQSPGAAFQYISGASTGESSRFMWARVKAEAERDLIALVDAVCWRAGFIDGAPTSSGPWLNRAIRPLFRAMKPFPGLYIDGHDFGLAMIRATIENTRGRVIENKEIREIAKRYVKSSAAST
jgi:hypothetical protein